MREINVDIPSRNRVLDAIGAVLVDLSDMVQQAYEADYLDDSEQAILQTRIAEFDESVAIQRSVTEKVIYL